MHTGTVPVVLRISRTSKHIAGAIISSPSFFKLHTGTYPTVYELSMRIPNILPFSIEYGMSEFINNPNMEINFYKNHLFLKNIFGITK